MQIGGTKYSFSGGPFDTNGAAIATAKSSKGSLAVHLQEDLTTGSDRITGIISGGNWNSELSGDLEVNNGSPSFTGKGYTLAIVGSTNSMAAPGGDGFGTLTISGAGQVSLGGTLADGTKISQSSRLSKYGQVPVYVSLYSGQGSLLSWITFSNEPTQDLSSDLVSWIKPPGSKSYPDGFTLETTLTGSLYASGTALSFTGGELILQGGGLPAPMTNQVLLSNNKVTLSGGKKPILNFTASSGVFSGSLTLSNNSKLSLGGVALQQTNLATGFFQNNGLSGQVSCRPGRAPDSSLIAAKLNANHIILGLGWTFHGNNVNPTPT